MQLSDAKPSNVAHKLTSGIARVAGAIPLNDPFSRRISPVMIVGCGRSGNTLLRSMLVAGGEIGIPPESYVCPSLARRFARWRFAKWQFVARQVVRSFEGSDFGFTNEILGGIEAEAIRLPNPSLAAALNLVYVTYCNLNGLAGRRWGDKTPLNILDIRVIEDIFPAAQYVHIVRDPRAVALSIVEAARTSSRIREKTLSAAAERWNKSVRNARALEKRIGRGRFHEVKYEALVQNPEAELSRLCRFLGLQFKPEMLSFYHTADRLGDVPILSHHAQVLKPLDPARAHSWRHKITASDRTTVERMTARYRREFGYWEYTE